jgi:hypothetical protein
MRFFPAFLCLSFLLAHDCAGQKYIGQKKYQHKGYAQVAFSVYGNGEVPALPGINFGAGLLLGNNVTTGAGFDIYMFKNKGLRFSQGYADFRAYFSGLDKAGPFVAVQPGVILLKNDASTKAKAGFSVNALGGFFVRINESFGVTASLGYGLITYSMINEVEKRVNGVKFNIGLCF